jgi:hypothetical protein
MLAWMRDKEKNQFIMQHYGTTQNQNCKINNNHSDDNVMRVSMWFKFFAGLFQCQKL